MQDVIIHVNSSCEFNTVVKKFRDVAIKSIKKGEEITSNYYGLEYLKGKCDCGSDKCRYNK